MGDFMSRLPVRHTKAGGKSDGRLCPRPVYYLMRSNEICA
jgi:hypothetical protein